jgi:hypothetical protein
MKKLLFISYFFLSYFLLDAQDVSDLRKDSSYWKLSGIAGANLSQAALVNWVAGGENTVAMNFYLNATLSYAKNNWSWDNALLLQYGVIYSDQYDWRKSGDKISLTSKVGYKLKPKLFASALFDFNTQFARGYAYPNTANYISTLMSPGYANWGLGIDYKPSNFFSFFFSPATLHAVYVLNDFLSAVGSYGLQKGKKSKYDAGALLKIAFKKELIPNVDVISSFDAFTPYNSHFGNVDLNWELLANFKINKLLTSTLNTTLRYFDKEHDVKDGVDKGPKVQFREIFGLGLAYTF